jgi:hypothetical protein
MPCCIHVCRFEEVALGAPAARELDTRLYVLPAVRKPTAKDSVVVSLLLVRYHRPFLLCNLCHLPHLALIHTIYALLELCPTLAVSPK